MTNTELENRYCAARRAVIARDFSHLNDRQREAVMTTEGPLLLLAGAGSGKTTVLINRIANLLKYGRGSDSREIPDNVGEGELALLEEYAASGKADIKQRAQAMAALDPVEPWRIIAITFTNKAANELKDRLERMLGPDAQDIWAMTFHSACVRILRRDCEKLGYARGFAIYDTSDSQSVMKRVLKELNYDEKMFPHRMVLSQISKAKDAMLDAGTFLEQAEASGDVRRIHIGKAYDGYARRLREANAMDFDDLIYNTVRLLSDHSDVRDYYQRRFRYVLIDEYQDTNNLQYLLASDLAGGYENICVVGDDDQSIYKFRGATIENILSFESQYKGARTIRLEQNYRSTGHILDAANAVISNNVGRKGKELWTEAEDGDKLSLYVAQNEHDEAQYVAARILENFSTAKSWKDNAVLYRMNAQSNQLEYAFKRNGIPYRIIGGTRFFDRAEVKDMLAYLSVIVNPADDLRLIRIVNTPARGLGDKTVEAARQIAADSGKALFEIIEDAGRYPELQRSELRLRQFANMINELREISQEASADDLYDLVIERTGYVRMLEEKPNDENTARIENVHELKTNIINYIKETGENHISGFLDEVALYTDIDNLDREADCVVMMTMHSAKGLEFPNVFIVGMEEGMFPGVRCIGEPEEMEEERRLCYVALTRAREKLYLCCARQRMLFGRTSANKVSRFVDEIPERDIDKPEPPKSGHFGSHGFSSAGGRHPQPKHKITYAPSQTAEKPAVNFQKGDMIKHKAFGRGMITALTPMGGDALIEIAFDGIGTKRLMLRAASQHMTKEK
ncbi:MAG: ATP-dependent helicase [Oscillospiraceae bacterium]